MSKKKIILITLPLLAGSMLIIGFAINKSLNTDKVEATVGQSDITKKHIEYRKNLEKCYQSSITEDEALILLVWDTLETEVLNLNYAKNFSSQELEEKAKWVDENTKAPDILRCIKDEFSGDRESYLKIFIQPILVNPLLRQIFSQDKEIHKEEYQKMLDIKTSLNSGLDLSEFDQAKELTLEKENVPPDLSPILESLNPQETYQSAYEDDYSWVFLKLLDKDTGSFKVSAVVVEKKQFDPWFKEYVLTNVKINIAEKENIRLKEKYSNEIWWL